MNELMKRLIALLTRGRVTAKDGSKPMRTVQATLMAHEVRDNVEHFEPYGFTSEAHPNAEVLLASLGGDKTHSIALCVADRRYRMTGLKDGEVAIFDDQGQFVKLARDKIHVSTPKHLEATVGGNATVNVTGDASVTCANANVKTGQLTVKADKVTYNTPMFAITGMLSVGNGMSVTGGSGGACATVNGTIKVTEDVIASGISLVNHTHGGVQSGGSNTGAPK